MIGDFALGDRVQMKKPHACGENLWTIIRVGADVKIKCVRCGRIVMMERADFVRQARKLFPAPPSANANQEGEL